MTSDNKTVQLFTKSYLLLLSANFLLYFGFWLLTPILPFYITGQYSCGTSVAGIVISCYTISALCIRPFSGYLLDSFSRKPLYLVAYFIFVGMMAGYVVAGCLLIFTLLRVFQGFAFGMVTVGGNTIVIDIMPSERRGEGLGYYGLTNNMAMATGPMTGLLIHNRGVSFQSIFIIGFLFCLIGFLLATMVKTPQKAPVKRPPVSLDRFILLKGIPAGFALMLLSIPYGMTTNYIAMYATKIGITSETGLFFTFMAMGMAISRIFAGKLVDRGYVTEVIQFGFYGVVLCFFLTAGLHKIVALNHSWGNSLFFIIPFILGVGFGVMFPAYNTLFVNLAPNNQRGTATSTYLTSWDIGLGLGIISGGVLGQTIGFSFAYGIGAMATVFSSFYFKYKVTPFYKANKLR